MQFKEPVVANFLTFQLMGENEVLQINGIYLNDRPALSEVGKIKLTHLKKFEIGKIKKIIEKVILAHYCVSSLCSHH